MSEMNKYEETLRQYETKLNDAEVIEKVSRIIEEKLDLKVPLMKEVRTHIAVARAFTDILDM
jgi:hypothetical protein